MLRVKRQLVEWTYHAGVVFVVVALRSFGERIDNNLIRDLAAAVLVGHVLTFRRIPIGLYIATKFIQTAACTVCGEVVDLVSFWRCSCGFVRERHVFSFCPQCGRGFSYIACPVCRAGMRI